MVSPSTGSPHLHTGPLPLQAWNILWWAPALEAPKSTHWPPSSAGRKSTMVGPITCGPQINTLAPFLCRPEIHYGGPHYWRPPNQHTGPLPLQAGNPLWWAPLLEAPKSTHWPPSYWPLSSAGQNQHGLAPLCRPKSNIIGPTLQAEINYCWPHSAGQNQLLVAPLCRPKIIYCYPNMAMAIQQYTPIGHQCQQITPCSTPAMASPVTHYPIPKMVSHNLSDHGSSYPGYRAISQYIHPPWCLQIICPEPKLRTPDTGLTGGKLLIRAMIPTPGLTNP